MPVAYELVPIHTRNWASVTSVHLLLVTSHTWSHIMVMMHVFLHSPLCHCQSHGLISVTCFWCFGLGKALVKTSAVCCGSWQLSIFKVFCSTWSCTQCQCVLIWFDLLWNWGFLAIAIEPSLSPLISVNSCCSCPNSLYRLLVGTHAVSVPRDKIRYINTCKHRHTEMSIHAE